MLRDLFLGFIRAHILFHAAEAPAFGVALMDELARHGYRRDRDHRGNQVYLGSVLELLSGNM